MGNRFDDILNECVEHVLRGESVEQCLERYPEQARELEPLLRIAAAAGKTSSALEPRPEFKARVRHQIQSQVCSKSRKATPKSIPGFQWIPRWAAVAACMALVFVFAAGGTVAASSGSVPGDTLYPVKTATEQVQLKLTFSKAAKAKLQANFAERRVREMARLAAKGHTAELEALAARFEAHLAKIEHITTQIEATDPEDSKRISELEDVLQSNMAKDQALLDAAEAKAPLRARAAIAAARFRLMQEYEETIDVLDEVQNQQQAQAGSPENASAGETDGSGPGGEMGGSGSTESGQQGQMDSTGSQVQVASLDIANLGSHCARPS